MRESALANVSENILDRLKFLLYNVDILIKEESYERVRSRITIDCCCIVCYSGISVQQLHPLRLGEYHGILRRT